MTNALIADALRVVDGKKPAFFSEADRWRLAAHYLAGQLEIALHDTGAGYSRLPPQRPTRELKVDRKDGPPLAVSKY